MREIIVHSPKEPLAGRTGRSYRGRGAHHARSIVAVALAVVALLAFAAIRVGGGGSSAPAVLASPTLTPGSLNPDVTQATIGSTICVRGWTATVRPPTSYTIALKARQLPEYGETGPPSAYQEDHLISLELGGNPTDPGNLWPEPYPRAADVDRIENELNAKVCSGRADARRRPARGVRAQARARLRPGPLPAEPAPRTLQRRCRRPDF